MMAPEFKHMEKMLTSGKPKDGLFGKASDKAMGLADSVDKESFLTELADQWYNHIPKNSPIEEEVVKSRERIKKSGFEAVFEKVGVTDEDLREVIKDIQEAKPDQAVAEPKVGRNETCPCGSGKKYKKCCGKSV